ERRELGTPRPPALGKSMTQKDMRAFAEFGDSHANRPDLENLQPWFAHVRLLLPHANDVMSSGSFVAAAPALAAASLSRSNLALSSGFTPLIIVPATLSRHCASQSLTRSFCRQRAWLASVAAHIVSQSVGRSGVGTTPQRAFFSAGSSK